MRLCWILLLLNKIMLNKLKKLIPFILLIIIISSLGVFIFGAEEVNAGGYCDLWDFNASGCIAEMGLSIFVKITTFFGKLIQSAANLLSAIINWGKFIEADIVKIGWGITRDISNMFFILILMIIAFATIFKAETYGMKKLLPKLIIAALLINFSLVLCGAIIDFTQVITDFFISQAGGEKFDQQLMNAFNATKGLDKRPEAEIPKGSISILWEMAIGAFLNVIFLLIILFVFAAFAVLLIIRLLMLQFLLILSPIVWLFWILPKTSHLWDDWWKAFIKWCFFAPASAFFIFLAIYSYKTLIAKSVIESLVSNDYGMFFSNFTKPEFLLQFILVVGILFGGLIAAQKIGIYGASGAISIAKGAGKKISGINTTQRWWKARKSAREDEAKGKAKRKAQLRRVGGTGQWRRETKRLTARGRAEARAKKNEVITDEAKKLGTTMNKQDVQKIAGKTALTKGGRMQKLAAQVLLADPKSKAHKQMMTRSTKLTPETPKYKKTKKLAREVNLNVARRRKAGEFTRYKLEKGKTSKTKRTPKRAPETLPRPEPKIEIITPPKGKFSDEEREKMKREAGLI